MKKEKVTIDYDNGADVLYLSFGNPRKAITEEAGDIGIRLDEKTNELVGITVIDFMKKFKKKHEPIEVSI